MKTRLIIDEPDNMQSLITIREGGEYSGPGTVVWDERVDDAISNINVGGYVRQGNSAVEDAARRALHDEAVYNESIPKEVTMRQAVLALRDAGYLSAVETWVAGLDGELEIYWNRSLGIKRDHSFVEAARVELGLTDQQMDSLFILAATKEG